MLGRRREDLQHVMAGLRKVPGIMAVEIIRRDGIVIDELMPRSVDSEELGAMAAAIVGTAEMAIEELNKGSFRESIVESERGKIVSMGAGREAILVAILKSDVNLGLALMTMEEEASKLGGILAAV